MANEHRLLIRANRRPAYRGICITALVAAALVASSCTLRDRFQPQAAGDDRPVTAGQVQARAEAGDAEQGHAEAQFFLGTPKPAPVSACRKTWRCPTAG